MDMKELLQDIKTDIQKIDGKLDNYSERLVIVESEHGFIKMGLKWIIGVVSTIIGYLAVKWFDIKI